MVAPIGEGLEVGFNAPLEPDEQSEDIVFKALQAQLAEGEKLRHYEPLWRKDYEGDPSSKRYIGGALLLEFTVFAADTFTKRETTVTDSMFPDDIRAQLDSRAATNWRAGHGWYRDYGRSQ